MREMPTSQAAPVAPADTVANQRPARQGGVLASGPRARAVLVLAVLAVAALVLLVPTAPLLGLLLVAAILGAVVAVLVSHVRRDHDERTTLDDLASVGYVVLHDRAAPGFAGTVRRLAIGPAGVFLVEVVDVAGRVRVRGDSVVVGGRSLALGTRLQGQMRAVSSALAPQLAAAGVHVTALVCMRRAELPLLRRSVAGMPLLREPGVVRRIVAAPSVMDAATVAWIAELARSTMPPVGRVAHDEEARDRTRRRSRRIGGAKGRTTAAGDPTGEPFGEAPSPA